MHGVIGLVQVQKYLVPQRLIQEWSYDVMCERVLEL